MLDTIISGSITIDVFLICTAVSLALGIAGAFLFMFRNTYTKSFVLTLAVLPAIIQLVIMMVNGNIGAGVAVAGAFGLVRFRFAPGTAKEITMLFLSVAVGIATGMGYVAVAVLFFAIVALVILVLTATGFGKGMGTEKDLRITIPENLDYDGLFDDLFAKYTVSHELQTVRTTNMGTLFELQYKVGFKGNGVPKAFIDELRCRNGNLNIVCGKLASKEALL